MAKPIYPKTNQEKARLYIQSMVEVKERISLIHHTLEAPFSPLFAHEICYLQLRFICELMAIGCLAAQGDYVTQRAFTEEYSPPKIFAALREVYPKFFPQVALRTSTPSPDGEFTTHHISMDPNPDAYTEGEIEGLWHAAGSHLHRASVNHYLKKTASPPPDLEKIKVHLRKLVALINVHYIPLVETAPERVLLLIEMNSPDTPVRALFLFIDTEAGTVRVEDYTGHVMR